MKLLKFLAAIIILSLAIATVVYLPLWVYFGFNALYLGVLYVKQDTFFSLDFFLFALCVGAPFYTYSVMQNLIEGRKWNGDT